MALFTGAFVLIVMLVMEYLIPNIHTIIKIIVVGLSAMIGGMLGNKFFPSRQ